MMIVINDIDRHNEVHDDSKISENIPFQKLLYSLSCSLEATQHRLIVMIMIAMMTDDNSEDSDPV